MIGAINSFHGYNLKNSILKQNATGDKAGAETERESRSENVSGNASSGYINDGNTPVQVKRAVSSEKSRNEDKSDETEVKALKQFDENIQKDEAKVNKSPVEDTFEPFKEFAYNLLQVEQQNDYKSSEGLSQDVMHSDYESREGLSSLAELKYNSMRNNEERKLDPVSIYV